MTRAWIALALTAMTAAPAYAAAPSLEGTYNDWQVFARTEGGEKICYVVTKPESMAPSNVAHGDVYFMVSSWRSGLATEQPSFLAGYPLKTTRTPQAKVGGTTISMYGADNEAYIESSSDERKLVSQMRSGSSMTVNAVSARGTETRYRFSLSGVTAALKKAKSLCAN
ncbi:invasion associated locus B family protein [Litorimonas sp. RW-G-Af-16]|uniref:invasion associated locus B family protein n=1 Tax=Litorimonas sp. RW-G-Af-16 TaxID=3241168 RepID=UPI00390CB438